jgi:hypothetical protein
MRAISISLAGWRCEGLQTPLPGHRRRYGELRPIYGEFRWRRENRKLGARPRPAGALARVSAPIRRIETHLRRIPMAPRKPKTKRPTEGLLAPLPGYRRRYGELRPIYGEFRWRRENRKPAPDRRPVGAPAGYRRRYGELRPIYGEFRWRRENRALNGRKLFGLPGSERNKYFINQSIPP